MTATTNFTTRTGNNELDGLLMGIKYQLPDSGARTLTYSFPPYNSLAISDSGNLLKTAGSEYQDAVRYQLSNLSQYLNVAFTEVTGAGETGDLKFSESASSMSGAAAYAYFPGGPGRVVVSPDYVVDGSDSFYSHYGWLTLLHEVGHALGLKHPHESEGYPYNGSNDFPVLDAAVDATRYTVMSYNNDESVGNYTFPQTYSVLDIQALQYLYGANASWNAASTNYTFHIDTVDTFETVWDGGGTDLIQIDSTADIQFSLRPGSVNSSSGLFVIGVAYNTWIENLTTGSGNDVLTGNDLANVLNGGTGVDVMAGGLGNDTYVLNVLADSVVEAAGEGVDTVRAGFTYTLADNLENLELTGAAAMNGYGNSANNRITGNSGANLLRGNGGTDTFKGGLGDDRYYVDSTNDIVTELVGEGSDFVYTTVSYTLSLNLERLYLQEGYAAALNATGNSGDNTLTGNTLNNILTGNGGKDTLVGRAGDDRYYVDSGDDVIAEKTGEGLDEVFSTSTYTLSNYVENLTLTGALAINAYGNSANNILTGNSAGNTLKGNGGTDTLIGGGGDDRYYVDSTGDIVTELAGEGTDYVYSTVSYTLSANLERLYLQEGYATALEGTGNSGANTLTGNSLNNILRGNGGADTLIGRAGDDKFYVDSADDVVAENAGEGTDEVISTANHTLGSNVENLSLGGTALTATGNSLANVIKGNSSHNTLSGGSGNDSLDGKAGNDVLDGGLGADTLLGGLSSDTYVVDNAGDVVTELLNEGTDVVQASISYALGANVEQLLLTGAAALNGTGNELANVLTGNSGANVLTGGLGGDTYAAARGMGADTLVDADATAGVLDILSFATGVAYDQLWFVHSGNHLEVSIIGTGDKAVVQDWYSGASNQIERIKTVDGVKTLVSTKVESLVTAMAGLTPPAVGQTTLSVAQHAALDGVIAASWS